MRDFGIGVGTGWRWHKWLEIAQAGVSLGPGVVVVGLAGVSLGLARIFVISFSTVLTVLRIFFDFLSGFFRIFLILVILFAWFFRILVFVVFRFRFTIFSRRTLALTPPFVQLMWFRTRFLAILALTRTEIPLSWTATG